MSIRTHLREGNSRQETSRAVVTYSNAPRSRRISSLLIGFYTGPHQVAELESLRLVQTTYTLNVGHFSTYSMSTVHNPLSSFYYCLFGFFKAKKYVYPCEVSGTSQAICSDIMSAIDGTYIPFVNRINGLSQNQHG